MNCQYRFELDCHYLYRHFREFALEAVVDYDLSVSWDREAGAAKLDKLTIEDVTLIVGGVELERIDFCDLHSSLQHWIQSESVKLDLQQLGCDEEAVLEEFRAEEDYKNFLSDHAAGAL